jgi:selenocysteine lyase/cysteine desulfurase
MVLIALTGFLRIAPLHYNSPEEVVHFLKVTEKLAK